MRTLTCVLLGVVVAGAVVVARSVAAPPAVEWFARDLPVRDLASSEWTDLLWLATAKGLYEARADAMSASLSRQPLLAGDFTALARDCEPGQGSAWWLASPQGLLEWLEVRGVTARLTTVPLARSGWGGRARQEAAVSGGLPPALALHSAGEHLYVGTADAIYDLNLRTNAWGREQTYFRWAAFVGAIVGESRPITDCRQICADRAGRVWALTGEGLLVSSLWNGHWQSGYSYFSPGGGAVNLILSSFAAKGSTEGFTARTRHGVPAALALDPAGRLLVLTRDRHLLCEPRLPEDNPKAQTFVDFPDVAGSAWLQRRTEQPTHIAVRRERLAVALRDEKSGSATLCLADPTGAEVIECPLGQVTVSQLAFEGQGRALWVATDRGLARVPLP